MRYNSAREYRSIRADARVSDSSFQAIKHLYNEIRLFRSQIKAVFTQDFRSSYTGTSMGIFWSFLLPIVSVTVYLFLAQIRVFPSFDGVEGATYLTFGVTIWFLFAGFTQLPISIVRSRTSAAMRTSLPLSASIVSGFANLIFDTLVRMCLVLVVMIWKSNFPGLMSPFLLLVFIPAFMLFFGLGLLLSILNVVYTDVSKVVAIALQYGIFVSGVIFPLGESPAVIIFSALNPFSVFVDASRSIVFHGEISEPLPLIAWSIVGILVFLLGCRMFYTMEYRIRGLV